MKKRTKIRLLGEAMTRTLKEISTAIPSSSFKKNHMKESPWTDNLTPICELEVEKSKEEGSDPIRFAVAAYVGENDKKNIDFFASGSEAAIKFSQEENYFRNKTGGGEVLERIANFLQAEFSIPADTFLGELTKQVEAVKSEHAEKKKTEKPLKTLGF